jgi:hypothetical protein
MMGDQSSGQKEVIVYIRLKPFLQQLATSERNKPEAQRRPVPELRELAEAVGITPQAMSNIVNGNIKFLNLTVAGQIITEIRRRGFKMELNDLMGLDEISSEQENSIAPPPSPQTSHP